MLTLFSCRGFRGVFLVVLAHVQDREYNLDFTKFSYIACDESRGSRVSEWYTLPRWCFYTSPADVLAGNPW